MDGVGKRVMRPGRNWRKIAQSRMNVLQIYQDGWGREKGMMDEKGWRKKHNLTECATDISKWMVWEKG